MYLPSLLYFFSLIFLLQHVYSFSVSSLRSRLLVSPRMLHFSSSSHQDSKRSHVLQMSQKYDSSKLIGKVFSSTIISILSMYINFPSISPNFNTLPISIVRADSNTNVDSIIEGVLDITRLFENKDINLNPKSCILIKIIDPKPSSSSLKVVAAAKVSTSNSLLRTPFRFQLFNENLLIPKSQWKLLENSDLNIQVSICNNDCININNDNDNNNDNDKALSVISQAEGYAKIINIKSGGEGGGDEDNKIRLVPYIRI